MLTHEISVTKPLAVGQAAEICRVTPRTINNWIRSGKLKAYSTPGGHFRIWPSDLRTFLKAHNMDINFEPRGERKKKILIIDDDESYAEMTREVLREKIESCEVAISHDGYEALILLGESKPDLVLLDLMMPGIDGFKMLELISNRKGTHQLKVLVLSGNLSSAAIERLKRSRADHWLAKPVSLAELLHSVQNLLTSDEPGGRGPS